MLLVEASESADWMAALPDIDAAGAALGLLTGDCTQQTQLSHIGASREGPCSQGQECFQVRGPGKGSSWLHHGHIA